MFRPSPEEEEWERQQIRMGAHIKDKFKARAFPPEPDGFREWLVRRYPEGDVSIPWNIVWQLHTNLVLEFREWQKHRRPIHPARPSIEPLRAWRRQQEIKFD